MRSPAVAQESARVLEKTPEYAELSTTINSPDCDPSGRTHFNIGLCYMTGDGTEIDCNAAIHYFKEAESRGYACWQRIEDCMKMREGLLCPPGRDFQEPIHLPDVS